MRADLDDLLTRSSGEPTEPLDVDELWSEGRRRRRRRRLSAAAGGLASIAVIAVALAAIDLGGPSTPEVAPLAPSDDVEEVEEPASVDPPDEAPGAVGDEVDEVAEAEAAEEAARERHDAVREAEEQRQAEAAADEDAEGAEGGSGPAPDPAALDDPCAPRRGGEMAAFIDVVAPVGGQVIDGAIELVGCSSVYEGTVRYRVLAGTTVLVDGFTTATAGGPEIGEFRQTIAVGATGPLTLQVFWESPVDGSEQDLAEIAVEAS